MVSIIVVCFNQIDYTRLCLESVLRHTSESTYELILIDNHSSDRTQDYLRLVAARHPRVRILENAENLGYIAAVNQGMEAARGEYILLLNNDVIVTERWLDNLLEDLQSDPELGAIGPVTNQVAGLQRVPAAYTELRDLPAFAATLNQRPSRPEWIRRTVRLVGFCELIRRDVVDRVGMLDPRFGMGNYDDDDYSLRIHRAGFRMAISQRAYVHHFGNATFRHLGSEFLALLEKNRRIFIDKWGFDPTYFSTPHMELLAYLPPSAKKIADIGCGMGANGLEAQERLGATAYGVEIHPSVAAEAARHLRGGVITGDVQTVDLPPEFSDLDVILFGDVIEHLFNPADALKRLRTRLAPGGVVIASIPNVQHYSIFAELLSSRWRYQDAGLLDRTHVRFYTLQEMVELFQRCGYTVTGVNGKVLPGEGQSGFAEDLAALAKKYGLPPGPIPIEQALNVYQFILIATPTVVGPAQPLEEDDRADSVHRRGEQPAAV